ncbi:unnamed protein product [Paramecium pentaurelia]|uniref:Uncharacterized protein n=1 Tax=Paramecium pentaurelia TaxID=43138 RepID=A0A8S1V9K0_9CILI|nr:unnamed protein product [Paramecium pentaurelia]
MQVNKQKCMFCEKLKTDGSFHFILKRALYCKYSQSQNLIFSKDINDILDDNTTKCTIHYKDHLHFNDQIEFMRRFYRFFESDDRLPSLFEYYKYHINIPRNFYSKIINKRMEKNRELRYLKIKQELGLNQEITNEPSPKKKDTSEDQSVSQMKNLLKDLKIESTQTDVSRVSNTTILKDLVKMIGNNTEKTKPFQIFNYNKLIQKQINPLIEAQKLQLKKLEQPHNNENTIKHIKQPSLTDRHPKSNLLSRNSSHSKIKVEVKPIKRPPQLKQRQASLGNIEITKSCQTTSRNNPQQNELLMELAKKVFSTKIALNNNIMTKKKINQQQNNNFFVKGRSNIQGSLKNLEDLKSSMRSLNVHRKTPNKLIKSHQGTPNQKKK